MSKTPSMPRGNDPRMPRLATVDAFTEFMSRGWDRPDRTPATEPGLAQASARHRERLSAQMPGRTIVVFSGTAPARANDTDYDFRPDSSFFWLTGCPAEDAVVVLRPGAGRHDAVLYVPEPAYPGSEDFFADAAHGELWVGPAPSVDDWSRALDIEARPTGRLE